jgi:hypothetical protein
MKQIRQARPARSGAAAAPGFRQQEAHELPRHLFQVPGIAKGAQAGTLDDMEGLQPQREIYTDHAVKWLAPVAGAARFAQNL